MELVIREFTTGLQHIGIPVVDLDEAVRFYHRLGFELRHQKKTHHNGTPVDAAFVALHDMVIELYLVEGDRENVQIRSAGNIDHVAINCIDIEKLYDLIRGTGIVMYDTEIQFVDFYDNGVKFFRVTGPNHEIIEFNQIL